MILWLSMYSLGNAEKSNTLILLNAQNIDQTQQAINFIEGNGGDVRHIFPPDVLIAYFPEEVAISGRVENNPVISRIFHQAVDPATIFSRSEIGIQGVKSWNYLLTEAGKVPLGVKEREPSPLVGDAYPPINVLGEEDSTKTSTVGWGSCYQIGRNSVGILFMESNGHDEDWTQEQYDRAIGEIVEGFDRSSSYAYEKRISTTWFYDIHYSVPTNSEPIQGDHCPRWVWVPPHWEFGWCNDALDYLGYSHGWDGMNEYVNDMRHNNQTEWGFIIYLVNDENDPDGKFSDGKFAYAWIGGPCLVMTYNNDYWGWWNMDEVVDHEKCHIFGAKDEYPDGCGSGDCTTPYGYLDVVNGNCRVCNSNPFHCIMIDSIYNDVVYCTYTNGHIGWRDSDGNYIPDPLDMGTQHFQNLWDVYPGDLITIYNTLGQLVKVISVSPDNCAVRQQYGRSVTLWDATNNEGDAVSYDPYVWKVNGAERGTLYWYLDTHAPYFQECSLQGCILYFRLGDAASAGGYVTITVFDADWNVVGYVMRHKFLTGNTGPDESIYEIEVPSGLLASGSYIKLSCSDGGGNNASPVIIPIDHSQPLNTPVITSIASIDTFIYLEWDDNNCFELGYIIERKDVTNDQWGVIDTTTWDTESYTDYQVMGSETYYYRIKAYNYFGSSGYSNTISKKAHPCPPLNLFVENFYCNRPYRPSVPIGKASTSTPEFEPIILLEKYCEPPYPDSIPSDASEIYADYPINQKPGTFAGMEVWSKSCHWYNHNVVRREATFVNLNRHMLIHTPPDTVYCSDWTYFFKVRTIDIYGDSSMCWPPGELDEIPTWIWPYACCVGPCHIAIRTPNPLKIEIPAVFSLVQNYPNPFNPETQIRYTLPQGTRVKLVIYNVLGRKVKILVDEYQTAGCKTAQWDGKDDSGDEVASGIYFYRLKTDTFDQTKRMVLMK